MQDPRSRSSTPKQLQMQFASTRLRGVSLHDRQQIVTRLAILLTEAAGVADAEGDADGR